ncbi:MAG: RcnB family protein [Sphingomonadaceae bacterium]
MPRISTVLLAATGAALLPGAALAGEPVAVGHSWEYDAPERTPGHGPYYTRIERGEHIPDHVRAPRYHVRDYPRYGLGHPPAGCRWMRYYDDALLVDPYGRVIEGRYGHDWSAGRGARGGDSHGVPVYVGDGDYEPGERDYAWVERYEDEGYRSQTRYAHPGYGHGGYGYWGHGYGGAYHGCAQAPCRGYLISETITTVPTYVIVKEVIEEEVYEAPPPRVYRPRTKTIHRRPPPKGEKG